MSPEQAAEGEVSPASDMFSLGTVMYRACSGNSPFLAKTALGTLRRICEETPPPLHELDATVPAWFSEVVEQLLSKDPRDRPPSMSQVCELLLNEGRISIPQDPDDAARLTTVGRQVALLALLVVVLFAVPWLVRLWNAPKRNPADGPGTVGPSPLAGVDGNLKGIALSPNIPPASRANGFFVRSMRETFTDLASSVEAAADGDVIDVYGDGPFRTEGLSLTQRITIRAADGSLPAFVNAHEETRQPFLQTQSELHLEGIAVRWANADRSPNSLPDRAAHCVISVVNADVSITDCRIITDSDNACLGCQAGSVELVNSHLVSVKRSSVVWIPGADERFAAENCVFEAELAGIVLSSAAEQRASRGGKIHLQENSFLNDHALHMRLDFPLREFEVVSRRNAFDVAAVLAIISRPQIWRLNPVPILFSKLEWQEYQNGYRTGTQFIRRGRLDVRPEFVIEASLVGWLATCGNPGAESFETDFEPRQNQNSENPSSPDPFGNIRVARPATPWPIGAQLDRVGPPAQSER